MLGSRDAILGPTVYEPKVARAKCGVKHTHFGSSIIVVLELISVHCYCWICKTSTLQWYIVPSSRIYNRSRAQGQVSVVI